MDSTVGAPKSLQLGSLARSLYQLSSSMLSSMKLSTPRMSKVRTWFFQRPPRQATSSSNSSCSSPTKIWAPWASSTNSRSWKRSKSLKIGITSLCWIQIWQPTQLTATSAKNTSKREGNFRHFFNLQIQICLVTCRSRVISCTLRSLLRRLSSTRSDTFLPLLVAIPALLMLWLGLLLAGSYTKKWMSSWHEGWRRRTKLKRNVRWPWGIDSAKKGFTTSTIRLVRLKAQLKRMDWSELRKSKKYKGRCLS